MNCARSQRRQGILVPECPPHDEIDMKGQKEYFMFANFGHETYKATYDLLFDFSNVESD